MEVNHKAPAARRLARACEANMRGWYLRRVAAAGGEVCGWGGVLWGYSPRPFALPGSDRIVAFPRPDEARADAAFERLVGYYAARGVAPWCTTGRALTPEHARRELRVWGFEYLSAAVCMAADLSRFESPEPADGVEIRTLDGLDPAESNNHPSYGPLEREQARNSLAASLAMARRVPKRVWNFGAYAGGALVGSSMLFVAGGVAGVYDVAVTPQARRRRIGAAVVAAACRQAKALGLRTAVLQNDASLIRFYAGLGFAVVSTIEHWQRPPGASVPTDEQRCEARRRVSLNGESFATAMLTHDYEEAARLLREGAGLASATLGGATGATLLHLAAYHGVAHAVRMLIEAGADLERPDGQFQSTPLGWALYGLGPSGPVFKQDQVGAAAELLRAGARLTPQLRQLINGLGPETAAAILAAVR